MGIDPDRLDGPIVGIASTWSGTMPCNLDVRRLADRAATAVQAAGGVPPIFNTIAVSDNQSQATPGMRASLVSREVIADSIPPEPRFTRGVYARYAAQVGSASEGAVLLPRGAQTMIVDA